MPDLQVISVLKRTEYVAYILIPEFGKFIEYKKVGAVLFAITVSAAAYGWLGFLSYENSSSSLFKRQLHGLVTQITLIVVGICCDKVNFSNRIIFVACSLESFS